MSQTGGRPPDEPSTDVEWPWPGEAPAHVETGATEVADETAGFRGAEVADEADGPRAAVVADEADGYGAAVVVDDNEDRHAAVVADETEDEVAPAVAEDGEVPEAPAEGETSASPADPPADAGTASRRLRSPKQPAPKGRVAATRDWLLGRGPHGRGHRGEPGSTRRPLGLSRRGVGFVVIVLTLGLLALYPARNYLSERALVHQLQVKHDVLEAQLSQLQAQTRRLEDPAFVDVLAERELGMVRPGTQLFVLVGRPRTSAARQHTATATARGAPPPREGSTSR